MEVTFPDHCIYDTISCDGIHSLVPLITLWQYSAAYKWRASLHPWICASISSNLYYIAQVLFELVFVANVIIRFVILCPWYITELNTQYFFTAYPIIDIYSLVITSFKINFILKLVLSFILIEYVNTLTNDYTLKPHLIILNDDVEW